MNIYLLRHGETDWNEAGRLQGHTDIPLNEKGKRQMEEVAGTLERLGLRPDRIVVSPLRRAQESAKIAAERLGCPRERMITEERLIECGFGAGEGLTAQERKAKYPDAVYPGMESFAQLEERARAAFCKITADSREADDVLVVAHGMILYALLTAVTGKKEVCGVSSGPTFEQGSIYRIAYSRGKNSGGDCLEVTKYSLEKDCFE